MRPLSVGRLENAFHPATDHDRRRLSRRRSGAPRARRYVVSSLPCGRLARRTALTKFRLPSIYHPYGWQNFTKMPKPPESEKLTINLGFVDLGSIDLLVRDGFYSNRSDFIRTAIRNQLTRHADAARQAASRLTLELGLRTFTRQYLEAVQAAEERLRIRVLGLAVIADDVTPDLARATIESITVLGALHAPADVKAALADRMR
jgi:Arc/MetJ-type ribon-helix-helix transcriptional regulator